MSFHFSQNETAWSEVHLGFVWILASLFNCWCYMHKPIRVSFHIPFKSHLRCISAVCYCKGRFPWKIQENTSAEQTDLLLHKVQLASDQIYVGSKYFPQPQHSNAPEHNSIQDKTHRDARCEMTLGYMLIPLIASHIPFSCVLYHFSPSHLKCKDICKRRAGMRDWITLWKRTSMLRCGILTIWNIYRQQCVWIDLLCQNVLKFSLYIANKYS